MNSYLDQLACNGGPKLRVTAWPKRHLFGMEEKMAAMELFDRCIESGDAFGYNGPEEAAYCDAFSTYLGGGYTDAVNSGTTAVYVALRALELEPFSEVIVPPITDPGGVMPVTLCACIPVPSDAAPGCYNMGAEQIEARISTRTKAILVAHISGIPCDMDAIMAVAKAHHLPVIEDCAQAHGAVYCGQMVGNIGDIGTFSTMSGKHHASGGQGGLVFTRNKDLYQKIRWMSDRGKPFGLPPGSTNAVAALNLNSDEMACAIGRVQLAKLAACLARRRHLAAALTAGCRTLETVRVVEPPHDCEGAFWFLLLHLDLQKLRCDKKTFAKALSDEGIPCSVDYWHAPSYADWFRLHRAFGSDTGFPWTAPQYQGNPDARYDLPNAKASDATHMNMCLHENCTEQEVNDTVAALAKVEKAFLLS